MRSAFSKQHFTVKDSKTGAPIPDVISVGNLMMGHETEKVRVNGNTTIPVAHPDAGANTGPGRYINISGNSDPDDPYIEFIVSDVSLKYVSDYQAWEVECRKNMRANTGRTFTITWYRNENLQDAIAQTRVFNARCKKFGFNGDANSTASGDKHITARLELECENIHTKALVAGGAGSSSGPGSSSGAS